MKNLYLILASRCFENADAFILLFVLEFSPLANVAHGVPPVPVFNCELLDGPGPRWERVLSSQRQLSGSPQQPAEVCRGEHKCLLFQRHSSFLPGFGVGG